MYAKVADIDDSCKFIVIDTSRSTEIFTTSIGVEEFCNPSEIEIIGARGYQTPCGRYSMYYVMCMYL